MIGESDFGWGSSEPEGPRAFGGVASAALVVASGVYCAALWVASGLQPLPYLALRVYGGRTETCEEGEPVR